MFNAPNEQCLKSADRAKTYKKGHNHHSCPSHTTASNFLLKKGWLQNLCRMVCKMEKRLTKGLGFVSQIFIYMLFHATFHQEHYKGIYLKTDLKTSVHSIGLFQYQ